MSRPARRAAVFLLAAGLLAIVLSQASLAGLEAVLARARAPFLVQAALAAAAVHLLIGARLKRSLPASSDVTWAVALDVSLRQSLLLALLPARGGDIVYPVLLARRGLASAPAAVVNLAVVRLCDVLALCVAALVGGMAALGPPASLGPVFAVAAVGAAGAGLALVFLDRSLEAGYRLMVRTGLDGTRIGGWLDQARRAAAMLRRATLAELLAWTVLRWLAGVVLMWLLCQAFGLGLGVLQALFAVALLSLAAAVPVQPAGGIGVAESALALALLLLGLDRQVAESAVVVRLSWFALIVLVGAALLGAGILVRRFAR